MVDCRLVRLAAVLLFSVFLSCAVPRAASRTESYLGKECLILEASGPGVKAIVMPETGGRVVWYGIDEENILWQNPDAAGRPRPGGGFQLDIGPEMRQIPDHPVLWSGKYRLVGPLRSCFGMTFALEGTASEPDPVLGLQVFKLLSLSAEGALRLDHSMKRVSESDQGFCFWDRTLCRSGGYTLIPVNPKSRFPAKWVLGKRLSPKKWDYNGTDPSHPQIRLMDGVLVAKTGGPEQKIGADSDAGWIAYALGTLLFVKYYPYDPAGAYTDGGLSVAHYFNDRIAELEPISPEVKLKPGESFEFPQRWTITRLDEPVTTFEQARALASRILPSPFKR
jgi:hypothetical protein